MRHMRDSSPFKWGWWGGIAKSAAIMNRWGMIHGPLVVILMLKDYWYQRLAGTI